MKNARAAGWGVRARWRREERASVLRAFPSGVPHWVEFFRRLYGVSADPEEFAAPRCPVFGIEEVGA